jgi:hypothetical protein
LEVVNYCPEKAKKGGSFPPFIAAQTLCLVCAIGREPPNGAPAFFDPTNVSSSSSSPTNTLYILAENQDLTVSQLLDFGKKWRADEVSICDGNSIEQEEDWEFRDYVSLRLRGGLWSENFKRDRDAAIVSYWWD